MKPNCDLVIASQGRPMQALASRNLNNCLHCVAGGHELHPWIYEPLRAARIYVSNTAHLISRLMNQIALQDGVEKMRYSRP